MFTANRTILNILIFCSVLILFASPTFAWLSGWDFRQAINISNTAGDLTNYQVRIDLNSSNVGSHFNWSNNGSDIRFTNSSDDELHFWIESWNSLSQEATIWVNVTYLENNTNTTIYMYYGNSEASSASDVNSTFIREIDGVVGSWHFDEGSGTTAYDTSGNDNDGTINGASWVDGKFGKGLNFDGTNDYVNVPDSDSLDVTSITMSVWVYQKERSAPDYDRPVAKDRAYEIGIRTDNGNISFAINNDVGWTWRTTDDVVPLNTWTFVAITYDSATGEVKVYKNGVLVHTFTESGNISASAYNLLIGVYHSSAGNFYGWFDGIIDEVGIYNRSLNSSEISDLYNYYGYTTENYPGRVLVRKYADPEPTISNFGSEEISTGIIINVYDNQTNQSLTNWTAYFTNGTDEATFTNQNNPSSYYWEDIPYGEINITISDGSDTKYYYNYTFSTINNETNLQTFDIYLEPKGNNTITLTATPSWSIIETEPIWITCTAEEGTPHLYMNGVEVSNPYSGKPDAGTYSVVCNVSETANYRPTTESNTLTVSPLIACTNNETFAFSAVITTSASITTLNFTKFVEQHFVKDDLSDVYVPNVSNVWKNTTNGYYIVVNNTNLTNFTVYFGNYYAHYDYSNHAIANVQNISAYQQENIYVMFRFLDEVTGQEMYPPNTSEVVLYISCPQGSNYVTIEENDTQFTLAVTSYPNKVSVRVQYSADSYYSRTLYPEQSNTYLLTFYLVDAYQYPLDRIDFVMQDSNYYNARLQVYKEISNQTVIISEGYFDASHTLSEYLMEDTDYYLRTLNPDGTYTEFGIISVVEPATKNLGKQTINLNPQAVLIADNILMNAYRDNNTLYIEYNDQLSKTEEVNITIYFSDGTIFKSISYQDTNSINLNYDISNYTNETFWVSFSVEHQDLGNSPVEYEMAVGTVTMWSLGISSMWYSLFALVILLFVGGITTRASIVGGTILFVVCLLLLEIIGWLSLPYVFIGFVVFLGILGIIIYVKQGGE